MTKCWDAAVIGAGPAGMSAAIRLAAGGASVALFDLQHEPGGQIYRGVERNLDRPAMRSVLGDDYLHGARLVAALRASGARLFLGHDVWQIDRDGTIWTRNEDGIARHKSRRLVIATGAMERPVPVQGWTLPGVMGIGALQILLKSGGMACAGPLALAGSGPLFYLFARQCLDAGISDLVLLDTSPRGIAPAALRHLPGALRGEGWRYLAKGMGLLAAIRRRRVRWFRAVTGISALGEGQLRGVAFSSDGRRHSIGCAVLGLHEGVIPHQHAGRSLGCDYVWDEIQLAFRPRVDGWGRSSVAGVFIAGDAAGIEGARAAEHAGRIAALAILHELGRIDDAARDREFRMEDRARRAHLAVRPFLDLLYRPREEILVPAGPVVVCRCEEVTAAEVRQAVAEGCPGPNQVKAFLRAGMGPCQGRMCGPTIAALVARTRGIAMQEAGHYRVRPPLRPVTLAQLADAAEIAPDPQ